MARSPARRFSWERLARTDSQVTMHAPGTLYLRRLQMTKVFERAGIGKVCPEADRFAAAVLMPADIFDAYALASGLDVVALHGVFRCSYAAAAIRLGEVMDRQPLFVALYERDEAGDPADWPEGNEPHSLRAKVVKRTAGFIPPASAPALRLPGRDSPIGISPCPPAPRRSGRSKAAGPSTPRRKVSPWQPGPYCGRGEWPR